MEVFVKMPGAAAFSAGLRGGMAVVICLWEHLNIALLNDCFVVAPSFHLPSSSLDHRRRLLPGREGVNYGFRPPQVFFCFIEARLKKELPRWIRLGCEWYSTAFVIVTCTLARYSKTISSGDSIQPTAALIYQAHKAQSLDAVWGHHTVGGLLSRWLLPQLTRKRPCLLCKS